MGNDNNTNTKYTNLTYSRELDSLERNTVATNKSDNFIISKDNKWKSNNEVITIK